eukprot:NODE_2236_length_1169_cov_14.661607_g1854_i0.p2 GENE.NODE_2236_length_1169_cov_14.661607_g1854_i0~~NODE_2236_length_1169_cov_14.661607_g1854_i0.p2  ORF type:complete len:68 (-),score=6.45 NODE_2236_length_1169_cov_14.661607_g1854_i0:476-679(-)
MLQLCPVQDGPVRSSSSEAAGPDLSQAQRACSPDLPVMRPADAHAGVQPGLEGPAGPSWAQKGPAGI